MIKKDIKNGFTLIELLAVIVILAIIAVIATPIITGIIEDAKKSAFERSVEGIVEATKFDISEKLTENGYTYEFENGEIDLGENVKVTNAENLSGKVSWANTGDNSSGPVTLLPYLKEATANWVGTETPTNYSLSQTTGGNYTISYEDE